MDVTTIGFPADKISCALLTTLYEKSFLFWLQSSNSLMIGCTGGGIDCNTDDKGFSNGIPNGLRQW